MASKVNGKTIANGLSWRFAERILAQGVSTIVSILLARILVPEEYGVVTMVLVFINIANVFVTSGFGQSLIQDRTASELEFSTMTFVSVSVSLVLYFILFLLAPIIAAFYKEPLLVPVLRVLALKIPLAGYNSIQQAYVQKHMMFKKFFFSTLGGTVISGVVGVAMAYAGFGVWALVTQYLINSTIDTIVLCFTITWKPKRMFSRDAAKRLFSFSWKLTVGDLAGTVYNELRSLVIGRVYTTTDLAYFNKGEQFPKLVINNINTSIISVLYPAMAMVNDTVDELKEVTRKSICASSFFLFPALVGLCAVAETFVNLILTDKWLPCVPFLQLACFSYITVPLSSANLQALKALGRSDLVMKLEIFKKLSGLILVIATMRFGVLAIAISGLVYSIIAVVANAIPNIKLLNYTFREQCMDLFPFALMSAAMGIPVYFLNNLPLNSGFTLMIQIVAGMVIYFSIALLTKNDIMMRLLAVVKERIKK